MANTSANKGLRGLPSDEKQNIFETVEQALRRVSETLSVCD